MIPFFVKRNNNKILKFMRIKVCGRIYTKMLIVVICRLMELRVILFSFFEICTFWFYCNHYVTFWFYKIKKEAKQPVLVVLKVLLILFLCRWPSWKILYVPDIWANKDSKRISPFTPTHTLVWRYLCSLPNISPKSFCIADTLSD